MGKDYKKIISIVAVALFLIFLAVFQISFINPSFLSLNLFLILAIYEILIKNNSRALVFAWLGGLLISSSSFSNFGINSLVLLIVTAILIIIYRTVFLTLKTESVLFVSIIGVTLCHFLNWLIINVLALFKVSVFESFGFYFANRGILIELIITTLLLLIVFQFKTKIQNVQKIS